jgi:hypothetical protein
MQFVQHRKHTLSQLQNQLIGRAIYSGVHSLAFHRGRQDFNTRSVHKRFFEDKLAMGHVSLKITRFPVLVSLHQYYILILIYIFFLPEEQVDQV